MNKTENFYDIYEYHYTPFWRTTNGKIAIAIIALIALAIIAFIIYRIIKKRRELKLILTPWDWAFAELSKLQAQIPNDKREVKNFYFSLTTILKKYLNKRYGWAVEDKTDDELIAFLNKKRFNPKLLENLEPLLTRIVEIKFADVQTMKEYIHTDLTTAQELITQTVPKEPQGL